MRVIQCEAVDDDVHEHGQMEKDIEHVELGRLIGGLLEGCRQGRPCKYRDQASMNKPSY